MFSLGKLIVLVLAVAAVWYAFKAVGRAGEVRGARAAKAAGATPAARVDAEDLVACEQCGAYVSAGSARSCGREDCPYPR